MTKAQDKWYWRGRSARAENGGRELPDGRISSKSRQEFYRGWDEEDRLRRTATTDDTEKSKVVLAKLREFASAL